MTIGHGSRLEAQNLAAGPAITDPLLSFIPTRLLRRLYGKHGERPAAVEFPAAVMFVDVSRYTALVEQHANRGKEGLEQIPKLIGRSYSRCADEVYESGGEVLWFAGDALAAYWHGDDGQLGHAVQAAVTCAERIRNSRDDRPEAAAGQGEPALHIGIGAGTVWAAAVGGQPLWNLLVAGPAVAQTGAAQSRALPWDYVLSAEATRALDSPSHPGPQQHSPDHDVTPDSNWLVEFVPPALRKILATGVSANENRILVTPENALGLDGLSEPRPITVLFARICGLDHNCPSALTRHHELCAALQEALRSSGGLPGELLFDDKGLVFTAVFGAPGCFRRDDASRALHAALSVASCTRRLGLEASLGLATGNGLFHVAGNARRRQLMTLGAAMNRAARLTTAARVDILCDAPTERASRSLYEFENRGTLRLEGLGDAAAIFRPVKRRADAATAAPLIGRDGEMEILRRAFEVARDGGRGLLVVEGVPGIGKSTLVKCFADELRAARIVVLVARPERDDRRTSLLPWRRILVSLLDLDPDSSGAEVLTNLHSRTQSNPELARRLPLLADMLGLAVEEPEATRHLSGARRADATMRLIAKLLGMLAPRPFVIVLEDSQWLDSTSWRLAEWVLTSLSSMLLVLCVRKEKVPELEALKHRADMMRMNASPGDADEPARLLRTLELQELAGNAIDTMVSNILGSAPTSPELARHIREQAGGNPLFAEEITLALKGTGLVAVRDGFWRPIRPLDALRYFDGVDLVIRERVDRLPVVTQMVLKAAAVAGRSFSYAAVCTLLGGEIDGEMAKAALVLLVESQLLRAASSSGDYEFRHDKIRDVIYDMIPEIARQKLHKMLACSIESEGAGSDFDLAILVQHFEAAGDSAKAVDYADLAATRALQTGAFREAQSFLEICFSHERNQDGFTAKQALQRVRWRRQQAEAQYSLGDIHGQGVAARRALKIAGEPVPSSFPALVKCFITSGLRLLGQELLPAASVTPDAQQLAREKELTRCLNHAATADYFELRFARAFCDTTMSAAHAGRTGASTERALAAAQLGVSTGIIGWRQLAHHFIARAEKIATALGDSSIHSRVCHLDALWRIGYADWPTVERRLRQSKSLCLSAGDHVTWCNAEATLFWAQYYRGELNTAEQTAQNLLSRAQNSGNFQQEIWALRCKAVCALHRENPREAVEFLELASTAVRGSADLAERIASNGLMALALSRVGRHRQSVDRAAETLDLLRDMHRPTSYSILEGIAGIAETLLRGREAGLSRKYGQWREWEHTALSALKLYARVFPVGVAQNGMWSGLALWLDGRKGHAITTWNRALETAQRMSLLQDQALIAAELRRRQIRR